MKMTDIALRTQDYRTARKWDYYGERVWIMDSQKYQESTSSYERRQEGAPRYYAYPLSYGRGKSGYLALEWKKGRDAEPTAEDLEYIKNVTIEDLLNKGIEERVGFTLRLVQLGSIQSTWTEGMAMLKRQSQAEKEKRDHKAANQTRNLPRMQRAVNQLKILNGNYYSKVYDHECTDDNPKVEVHLNDLLALLEIAQVVIPALKDIEE